MFIRCVADGDHQGGFVAKNSARRNARFDIPSTSKTYILPATGSLLRSQERLTLRSQVAQHEMLLSVAEE